MSTRRLGEMRRGESGVITCVGGARSPGVAEAASAAMTSRLLEMGLLEGSRVEVVLEAPFGGDPIAVRVRGGLIALRRSEANLIEVSRV